MKLAQGEAWEQLAAWVVMVVVFAYVAVRAAVVPLAFDESVTAFYYIFQGEFWPGHAHWDANNHILNSLLASVSTRLFGGSELALRLPNVLAALVYLGVSYLFSFKVNDRPARWALFLSLVGSHFVIEFLGYTRGYGLSMALMLLAIWFLFGWMERASSSICLLAAIAAMQLATLANLSLLPTNLLVCLVIPAWLVLIGKRPNAGQVLSWLAGAGCAFWFVSLLLKMKEKDLLYYGSGEGFWQVTVRTLAENAFGPMKGVFMVAVPILTASVLLFTAHVLLSKFRQKKPAEILFPLLLFGNVFAALASNWLLGVNFPEDRVGMYYLPLLPLAVVYAQRMWFSAEADKLKWARYFSLVPLMLFPMAFILMANVTHATPWKLDSSVKQLYQELAARTDKSEMPTIAGYHLRRIPYYYYNMRNGDALPLLDTESYGGDEADFQMSDLKKGDWEAYDTIAVHEASGTYLMERKRKREKRLILTKEFSPKGETEAEYYPFVEGNLQECAGKDMLWRIQMEMNETSKPLPAHVVAEVHVDDRTVMMPVIYFNWVRRSWKQGELFDQLLMMPNVPEDVSYIKLYYWNITRQPQAYGRIKIELFEILPDKEKSATL